MFAQDAYALSKLAYIIGRYDDSIMLKKRADDMKNRIQNNLWHEELGIYANRLLNGTFYPRISPTSFYPMQANVATDEQADMMITKWLLNSTRFCIARDGDFKGNDDTCYWGLPSINAADPAFPPLGYWRGYVWGPMAQLTFWGMQNYDTELVTLGRKSLCKQMEALFLSQWNEHRHVCENYNPHKTADTSKGDCSGTYFYHWGALTALIGLMEDGLY